MRSDLWGEAGDLDYWSALALGQVGGPERKAVDLLRRVVDEERASLYLQTGMLPIMGNVTRRCYFALKSGGCLEMEDGLPVAWWCFSVGPYAPDIPDTDQVLSVRMIVEGEELAMFTTGDRHPGGYHFTRHDTRRRFAVADPFVVPFIDRGSPRPDLALKTSELLDLADLYRVEEHAQFGNAHGVGVAQNVGIQYAAAQGVGAYLNAGNVVNVNYQNVAGNAELGQDEGDQDFKRPVRLPPHEERLAQEERANGEAMGLPSERPDTNDLSDNYFHNVRQGPFEPLARPMNLPEIRERVRAEVDQAVQAAEEDMREYPLVQRAPVLPAGMGIDMHDGTVLHVNEALALRLRQERGVDVQAEIRRMQDEGASPENIEIALNALIGERA